MQRLAPVGSLGKGCASASCLGAALLRDWPRPELTLLRKTRKTDRFKAKICAVRVRCERRTIRRALSRGEKAFHSLPSGTGCEVRFGVERDFT